MGLDQWLEKAKKDGIVKDKSSNKPPKEEKKEVNMASSPTKGAVRIVEDEKGYEWAITKRGLRFPLAIPVKKLKRGNCIRALDIEDILHNRFGSEYPCVKVWIDSLRSESTKRQYGGGLLYFCMACDISPKEFADLWETIEKQNQARKMATNYILPFIRTKPHFAVRTTKALKSFFRRTTGFPLPLDSGPSGALEVKVEDTEQFEQTRFNYGTHDEMREHMDRLLKVGATDLKHEVALTFLAKAGLRRNTVDHLKIKHVQDIITMEDETGTKEELLCLTVTGYNPRTDEGICEKTHHYKFPKLLDAEGQPRGYYTFLARDALKLFRRFMAVYHSNSKPDDLLFPSTMGGSFAKNLLVKYKRRVKLAGYPAKIMRLHDLRWMFDELAHEVLKANRAEMLAGHKLKGVQEHYQKRNKLDLAKDYLKINFKLSVESLKKRWKEDQEREEKKKLETKPKEPEAPRIETPVLPTEIAKPQATVESVREEVHEKLERILKPAPKHCLRGKTFGVRDTDAYCHNVCSQQSPTEYKACQELREEQPNLFA